MALLAHTLKPFHPRVCLIAPPYAIVGGTLTARRRLSVAASAEAPAGGQRAPA